MVIEREEKSCETVTRDNGKVKEWRDEFRDLGDRCGQGDIGRCCNPKSLFSTQSTVLSKLLKPKHLSRHADP